MAPNDLPPMGFRGNAPHSKRTDGPSMKPTAAHSAPAPRVMRNIVANYAGSAWSALMGVIFLPWYVRYLGTEAYGVVGVGVVLQAYAGLLDLGLTALIGREIARFSAGSHDAGAIRSLLRVIELAVWATAAAAVLILWSTADWIATQWLRGESLSTEEVSDALRILALVIGIRFAETLYRSCLLGLQSQVTANAISSAAATLRGAGAVMVLAWWSPTLNAFFWWQGAVSMASLLALAVATHRLIPRAPASIRAGIGLVRGSWGFAGGMVASSFLVLLLNQTDKVMLSRLLSLPEFGAYSLCVAVVGAVALAGRPIGQAIYPRLTGFHARGRPELMAREIHRSAQLITLTAGSACVTLVAFAEQAMLLWTGDEAVAADAGPTVRILAVGTFVNVAMTIPYFCQLAAGWTSLANVINLLSVAAAIPALLWAVPRYGAEGAAAVWLALNIGYLTVAAPISFSRVARGELGRWYLRDLMLPFAAAAAVAACARIAMRLLPAGPTCTWFCMAACGLAAATAATLAAPELRAAVGGVIRGWRSAGRRMCPADPVTTLPPMDRCERVP